MLGTFIDSNKFSSLTFAQIPHSSHELCECRHRWLSHCLVSSLPKDYPDPEMAKGGNDTSLCGAFYSVCHLALQLCRSHLTTASQSTKPCLPTTLCKCGLPWLEHDKHGSHMYIAFHYHPLPCSSPLLAPTLHTLALCPSPCPSPLLSC